MESGFSDNNIFDNVFLTGAGFGIEASIIAIIGYILVCGFVLIPKKK